MKVLLDADAIRYPLTGVGRYSFELARQLTKIPEIELSLLKGFRILSSDILDVFRADSGQCGSSFFIRQVLGRSCLLRSMLYRCARWAQGGALRGYEDHVFHGPNFKFPPFEGASVVTVHDLSVFHWAECHPSARVKKTRKDIADALQRANVIITDSEFTRNEIADFFGTSLKNITAVPLACSEQFRPREKPDCASVLRSYGLEFCGYCLFSGTIEPRKNIGGLLDAYEQLPVAERRRYPLVLCGGRGWKSEDIHRRIEAASREGWVRYLGYVPDHELPILYAAAKVFLFPSLYEGFGLPVLEAMASGTPVVCSNAASLPEVAGTAALMCAAEDSDRFSRLIVRALQDDDWRKSAIVSGLEQSGKFNWSQCAAKTVEVYRAAIG